MDNSHGAGRFEYIQKLCDNSDFILIQEHWLVNNQSYLFEKRLSGIRSHSISGMDDNTILKGRPFGGCAILWNECLKFKVTPISTDCKRLCCIVVENGDFKLLICNVYMPTYSTSNDYITSFNETLSKISSLLMEHHIDHTVIGGDFNVNLKDHATAVYRYVNSFFAKRIL